MTANPVLATRLLIAGVVLALAAWLVSSVEWITVREPLPLAPELARDGNRLAREYLGRLGLQARSADNLGTLPPANATLVLTTRYWDVATGASSRLQQWVQAGGHLVIDGEVLQTLGQDSWLPLRLLTPDRDTLGKQTFDCRVLTHRPELPLSWGSDAGFVACLRGHWHLRTEPPNQPVLWALESDEHGTEALRVAVGRGRITAFAVPLDFASQRGRVQPDGSAPLLRNMSNRGLIEGDNAALLAALLDAQVGGEVWFVTRTERAPLLAWLWQHAAPALLLAALALALALWRGGARFGPQVAAPLPVRRSFAAQIQGSAEFLFRHQPAALHAASLRALHEAATRQIAGWARLRPASQAAALARASGLPPARLAQAMGSDSPRNAAAWSDALAVLETARRTLNASTHTRPHRSPESPR